MSLMLEILLPPFVACLILTGIHTYLGLHVVSRGVIFVDLALAQIAALGATFAFLLGYDPHGTGGYVYSLVFAFIGAAVFSLSRLRDQRVPQEAIIGITFAVASAAAILIADFAPQGSEFIEAMLTGALLWVSWGTIAKTAAIYGALGVFHWVFRKRFLTLSMEPEKAEAEGWNLRWWDFLFYMSFGFVITSSVAMAGVLLVFSFLVIPSVIAMLFADRVGTRLVIGWISGTLVSTVGLAMSYAYDFPSGPAVVCTFGAALVLAASVRYVITAERPIDAISRVAASGAVIGGAFWLAFAVAERGAHAAAEPLARPVVSSVESEVREALRAIEASPDAPPQAAVDKLLDPSVDLHLLITTGSAQVSETAVRGVANAGDSEAVTGLLDEIAHHALDSWARLRAAQALVERGNLIGAEVLVDLLGGAEPVLLSVEAVTSLREIAGEDFGYDPLAPDAERHEALDRWRAWWEERRHELEEPGGR